MNLEKQLIGEIENLEKECKGCEDYHLGKEGMRCYKQRIIQADCDIRGKLQALKSTFTKLQKARRKLEEEIEKGRFQHKDERHLIQINKVLILIKEVLGSEKV